MRRGMIALGAALILSLAPMQASAQAQCRFVLGFATLRDLVGSQKVGACLENEHFNLSNGNAEQRTTGGLLAWRKVDNFTAFTDGGTSWVNGPNGLQSRSNDQRFSWELDALPSASARQTAPQQSSRAALQERCRSLGVSVMDVKPGTPLEREAQRLVAGWGGDDSANAAEDMCNQAASKNGAAGVDCFEKAFSVARGQERLFPGQGASSYQSAYDRCIGGR